MDSITIQKLLEFETNFVGVFARDTIPQSIPLNSGMIANTDPITRKGEHWIAFYKDQDGHCEYFDPYGLPPLHDEFEEFLSRNSTIGISWNRQQLQCIECITCGYYCVEYIKYRCNGYYLKDLLHSFTNNPYINDIIVQNRITNNFNKN